MIKMPLSAVRVAVFCLPLALVASCGSGSEAVQGSVINIDPSATAQVVRAGTTGGLTTAPYRIEVRSPSGVAQIGVQLIIQSPGDLFSVDDSGFVLVFTPMGGPPGSTYTVTTSSNGVYNVGVTFTSGTTPTGEVTILSASSGTAFNRVNMTFTCVANLAPVTPCP